MPQDIKGDLTVRRFTSVIGGLKDADVTTAISLGNPSDTSFNTSKKDIVGAVNEAYRGLLNVESTGLISGGVLSINSDPTKFDLTAGTAIIVDNHTDPLHPTKTLVSWGNQTAISDPLLMTDATSYLYVDSAGVFHFQNTILSAGQRRIYADIGWIDHPSLTAIEECKNQPDAIIDIVAQLNDFLLNFGPFNIDGNEYDSAGGLHIQRTAGSTFDANANYWHDKTSPHITTTAFESPVDFFYCHQDGLGGWVNQLVETSSIDPNHWDDGSGLSLVSAGSWTIQIISFYSQTNENDIQYGQNVYDTYADAKSALQDAVAINPYNAADTFRAWLIVQQGCTDLNDTSKAMFISAGKLGMISVQSGGGAGGEVNTASNDIAGTGAGQIFGSKVGVDLVFKKIAAGSGKLTISNGLHDVTLDVSVSKSDVGLSAVTNDAQVKKIATSVDGNIVSWDGTTGDKPKNSGIAASGVSGHIASTSNPHSTSDANLVVTDVVTNNFSTSKHGFVPKGTNLGKFLKDDGTWATVSGSGDVVGPSGAVANKVVIFDGTTGKLIKDSGLSLSGSNTGDQVADGSTITGAGTIADPFVAHGGSGNQNFQIVADTTARNAIVSGNRYIGMLVRTLDTGYMWTLIGGILDANWQLEKTRMFDWTATTPYRAKETIIDPSTKFLYRVVSAYTSSSSITTDITASHLELVGGSGSGGNPAQIDQSISTGGIYGLLSGAINGTNTTFTVSKGAYTSGNLKVFVDGQLQTMGSGADWTETTPASGTFDLTFAPVSGQNITVEYGNGGGGSGSGKSLIPDWMTATIYVLNEVVTDPSSKFIYRATMGYTSGSSVAADVTAGKLVLIGGSGSGGSSNGYFPGGWV